eukprot:352887-Chlamydomonas_euryale.AAC.4
MSTTPNQVHALLGILRLHDGVDAATLYPSRAVRWFQQGWRHCWLKAGWKLPAMHASVACPMPHAPPVRDAHAWIEHAHQHVHAHMQCTGCMRLSRQCSLD